jgi:Zn-dependent metalloprotease
MAYHWITESERYIQGLGFTNINNRKLKITINGVDEDNSFYDPATGSIIFGTGGIPDAQDAEIILHETGHSIQDSEVTGFGHGYESGAMGEGFGDYWAGSFFAGLGPKGHGWDVYIGTWDATAYNPGNPAFLRRLDSPKQYPKDMAPDKGEERGVHANAEIWSACLWQIRDIVGRKRADTMILESHFALSPDSTFADGARAVLQANKELYQGADEPAIRQVFVKRGIL